MELEHITLSTGHMRMTSIDEVDPTIYFKLRALIKDFSRPNGADFWDNSHVKLTQPNGSVYICTVSLKTDMGLCPILTTGGTTDMHSDLWETLHESAISPVATKASQPPDRPYIADRIDIPHPAGLHIRTWTGDFSRCLAWMLLYPAELRRRLVQT